MRLIDADKLVPDTEYDDYGDGAGTDTGRKVYRMAGMKWSKKNVGKRIFITAKDLRS